MGWCRKVWILSVLPFASLPLFKEEEHAGDQHFCWSNYSHFFHPYIDRRMLVQAGSKRPTHKCKCTCWYFAVYNVRGGHLMFLGRLLHFWKGLLFFFVCQICSWAVITHSMPLGWMGAHQKDLVLPLGCCLSRVLYSGNALYMGLTYQE
jgi:hypothetical protein